MGVTPLEGLMMDTRTGDLDPAVVVHLAKHHGLSADEVVSPKPAEVMARPAAAAVVTWSIWRRSILRAMRLFSLARE